MDHHETAATDIACARIGDRKREADRDCGIDRIAAAIEDFDADARGAAFLRDHDAIAGRIDCAGGMSGGRETGATCAKAAVPRTSESRNEMVGTERNMARCL